MMTITLMILICLLALLFAALKTAIFTYVHKSPLKNLAQDLPIQVAFV